MKILMVCLGNICRSPMAQGILENKLANENLDIEVDSAGTSDYHVDDSPDSRAIEKSMAYNIDISHYRGRQFQRDDFKEFDRIFAMDSSNYQNIVALAENTNEADKVEMILNLSNPNSNMSVPDPYFGAEDGFEQVYQLLEAACDILIDQLKNERS